MDDNDYSKEKMIELCNINDQFEDIYKQKYLEVTQVPFDDLTLSAMMYIATITYPHDHKKRDLFINVMTAALSRYYFPKPSQRKSLSNFVKKCSTQQMDNQLNKSLKIISKKRYVASFMLHQLDYSKISDKELTRNVLLENAATFQVQQHGFEDDLDNIRNRIWNDSKPVLFLSYSFFEATKQFKANDYFFDYLINTDWVLPAIKLSEEMLNRFLYLEKGKNNSLDHKSTNLIFEPNKFIRLIFKNP